MPLINFTEDNSIWCHITGCQWTGNFKELKEHVNNIHPNQIRKIHPESYFELSFEDLTNKDPFLLCTENGNYWFDKIDNEHQEHLSRGVFEVAGSETVQYYIKLGTFSTKLMQIQGPFSTQKEGSLIYDFDMEFKYIQYLTATMTPKVVIFFGEFEEDADEYGTCGMGQWPPGTVPQNFGYPETFVCSGCEELVAGTPLYCHNRHILCDYCNDVIANTETKCPQCTITVFRDSRSEDIGYLLFHSRYQNIVEVNGALYPADCI